MRSYLHRDSRDQQGAPVIQPSLPDARRFAGIAEALEFQRSSALTLRRADGSLVLTETIGIQHLDARGSLDQLELQIDYERIQEEMQTRWHRDGEDAGDSSWPGSDGPLDCGDPIDRDVLHDLRITEQSRRSAGWDSVIERIPFRYQLHVVPRDARDLPDDGSRSRPDLDTGSGHEVEPLRARPDREAAPGARPPGRTGCPAPAEGFRTDWLPDRQRLPTAPSSGCPPASHP